MIFIPAILHPINARIDSQLKLIFLETVQFKIFAKTSALIIMSQPIDKSILNKFMPNIQGTFCSNYIKVGPVPAGNVNPAFLFV